MHNHNMRIINARLVTPYRIIENGQVDIENGKITYVGEICQDNDGDLSNYEIIDAENNYASSGFIDIHTHGAGGCDFMDCTQKAFETAAYMYAKHGCTTALPTTLACEHSELIKLINVFNTVKKNDNSLASKMFYGLHLEGPYFSLEQRGAQDTKYIKPPCPSEYNEILSLTDDIVRWSSAVELEGNEEFAQTLRKHGILASIGHSNAVYEQVVSAFESGFRHITHLYSCMSGMVRLNSYRYPGVIESAFMLDEMTVEIIADGKHLPPSILKHVYKSKGADKTVLVTDSMRGAGMPDGKSILGSIANGQEVLIEDGVAKMPDRKAFAGSVVTADRVVRNMIKLADTPLCDAVRMMTSTPARVVGIKNKGILARGYDADIIIFDDDIDIKKTIVAGKAVDTTLK